MDSGRLFRAVITGITLLACIWALEELEARRAVPKLTPADSIQTGETAPSDDQAAVTVPAVDVQTLPFVALDNTCFDGHAKDLSRCTGVVSGGQAREYRLTASGMEALYIGAMPRSDFYDLSFALLTADERCVAGHDNRGPGLPEAAIINGLEQGEYVLVIGGYGDDCGPYELTVREGAPGIAHVLETNIHTGRNGKVVRWGTFAEVDLTYFVLYRTDGETRHTVAVLRARGSPAGFAKYRVMDRQSQPDSTYEIEVVARDGRRELIGIAT